MKKYRTPQSKRATYTYYTEDGIKIGEIRPGVDGVTEANIAVLHGFDDDECRLLHADTRNDSKYKPESTASLEELDANGVWIAGCLPNPQDAYIRKENIASVHAAIDSLPAAQQESIIAVWLEGMSAREYAKSAGKTESAVSQLLDRAFKNLRKTLSQ